MLLAPSSPTYSTRESSTGGLAEPAWEVICEVHDSDPTRLVRPHMKGRVGGGLFRLNQACVRPLS